MCVFIPCCLPPLSLSAEQGIVTSHIVCRWRAPNPSLPSFSPVPAPHLPLCFSHQHTATAGEVTWCNPATSLCLPLPLSLLLCSCMTSNNTQRYRQNKKCDKIKWNVSSITVEVCGKYYGSDSVALNPNSIKFEHSDQCCNQ